MMANRLSRGRELAGLSLSQAAFILGVGRVLIEDMEAGRAPMIPTILEKMSRGYACAIEWLRGAEPRIPESIVRQVRQADISPKDRETVLEFAGMLSLMPPQPSVAERLARIADRPSLIICARK